MIDICIALSVEECSRITLWPSVLAKWSFSVWYILQINMSMCYDTIWYDIFNCNWVATRWQLFSTHVQANKTENVTKQTINRSTQKYIKQHKKYIEQHNYYEECGPCPVFGGFTLAFALQLRKKNGKTSVRVNLSQSTDVNILIHLQDFTAS